jgi:hypothetical protein
MSTCMVCVLVNSIQAPYDYIPQNMSMLTIPGSLRQGVPITENTPPRLDGICKLGMILDPK